MPDTTATHTTLDSRDDIALLINKETLLAHLDQHFDADTNPDHAATLALLSKLPPREVNRAIGAQMDDEFWETLHTVYTAAAQYLTHGD